MKTILATNPHAEHQVYETDAKDNAEQTFNNRLFTIADRSRGTLRFTGEELTSLSKQWLAYAEGK